MADLKEEFGRFKNKIRRSREKNAKDNNLSLFNETGMENSIAVPVDKFLKKKRISKKEMIRFYISEMTGLTEEEFNEHFFDGKKAKEKKEVIEAIRYAVEYKIKCDQEEIADSDITKNSYKKF